jgi:hypothetical protein
MNYQRCASMIARLVTVLCLAATTGCVSQRSATVTGVDGEKSIQLKHVTTGLLAGPCIPAYPGRTRETYWIKLQGDGPTYSTKQISFVNSQGESIPAPDSLHGEVRLDRAKHVIIVDIHQGDTTMPYNGSYRYQGDI